MAVTPDELAAEQAAGASYNVVAERRIRPFTILPGGAAAAPDALVAGGIILGSLALLWLIRRNLDNEPGHVHAGGTAAIIFLLYYLMVQGGIRVLIDRLSNGGERDTALTRGLAFFA